MSEAIPIIYVPSAKVMGFATLYPSYELSPKSRLFPPDRHLARRPPSETFVKRPPLPGRMKDRIANAELADPLFGQRHQPLGQSLAAILGLDEDVEE